MPNVTWCVLDALNWIGQTGVLIGLVGVKRDQTKFLCLAIDEAPLD